MVALDDDDDDIADDDDDADADADVEDDSALGSYSVIGQATKSTNFGQLKRNGQQFNNFLAFPSRRLLMPDLSV